MTDNKLNKAQKEAIEYTEGPLLIVAGAGTGKTTVITQKISHLIDKKLAQAEEILALTFTDKAATEMIERVDDLMDIGYADMRISTFHNFCKFVLQQYGLDIGISNQFKVLTEIDAWLLVRTNFDKFDLNYYRPIGNPTRHIHELIQHFSKCKDELISSQDYLDYATNVKLDKDSVDSDERSRLTEIANAYHKYNQLLLDNNSLDFADLIYYTVKLLEKRPNILKALQDRFKYILVDEFQDVNWSQYKLVQMIAGKTGNLTVVGDDDQSIYAFRGASVSNIMRFKDDYKKAKEVVLNENYRSGQEVLDIAYKSVQNNNPDRLEVKLKIDKRLISKADFKSNVEHIRTFTAEDEVASVVQKILELRKDNESAVWDDFAILVRANSNAEPFLHALESAKIPFEFIASNGLYNQPIVLDCVNFLKLLDDYHEQTAVYRLLCMPFLGFSVEDMQKFTSLAKRKSIPYFEALKRVNEFYLSNTGANICAKLLTLINNGMQKVPFEKPTTILYHFLEDSGYLAYLAHEEGQGNAEEIRQIYQLKQFMEYIDKFQQSMPGARIPDFMEHYRCVREAGDDGKLYQPTDTPDSVNVMTVHASKGMEFKYVFIVNAVDQRFPVRPRGDAIEIPVSLIKEQLPEGDSHYQEERRLFYVAMTRAKEKLFFTSADNYGGAQKRKISRFLDELGFSSENTSVKIPDESRVANIAKPKNEKVDAEFVYEIPKSFSFSQIKTYQTCPYQYKLAHVLKIPSKGSASFSFGTTIHNTLHQFYQKVQELNSVKQESLFGEIIEFKKKSGISVPPVDDLLKLYDQNWIDEWYISKKQREDYYKKGKEVLKSFYKAQKDHWTIPVIMEKGFKIKIGGYLLSGRVDRVDKLPDGTLEIIDYKTGKTKEKVTGDDKDQLLIYQIVAETLPEYRNLGEISKLTYYYVEEGVRTEFIGKPKDIENIHEKIKESAGQIQERNFTATPGKHICEWCNFKDICEFRA